MNTPKLTIGISNQTFTFRNAGTIKVGRDTDNDVKLYERKVSAHHCEIMWDPEKGAMIRDMGSANGTKILRGKREILVGRRPRGLDRSTAEKYVSEFVALETGDQVKLYSAGILEVEFETLDLEEDTPVNSSKNKTSKRVKTPEFEEELESTEFEEDEDCMEEELESTEFEDDEDFMEEENAAYDHSGKNPVKDYEVVCSLNKENAAQKGVYLYVKRLKNSQAPLVLFKVFEGISDSPQKVEMERQFRREVQIVAKLRHKNIAQILGTGRYGELGKYYIKMKYYDKGNLAEYLAKRTISEKEAVRIVLQILEGLQYAHYGLEMEAESITGLAKGVYPGIVHRDINPRNILIEDVAGGNIKIVIADFGLAKVPEMSGQSGITDGSKDPMRATLTFSSVHQIKDPLKAPKGVDIWSAMAILFWMLTGELPRDMSEYSTMVNESSKASIVEYFDTHPVRKIRDINPNVTKGLAKLIDGVLEFDHAVGYNEKEEVDELIQCLERFAR